MRDRMFHVFRNTPFGRENFLQSIYFCQMHGRLPLTVYIPQHTQFNMRFGYEEVMVILNKAYARHPETAKPHAEALLEASNVEYSFFEPSKFDAHNLPSIPTNFHFMGCPRAVSEQMGRVGLGHIGPKVRAIVKYASFGILIPSYVFKPWKNVAVFYGGSNLGAKAVKIALYVADRAGVPLKMFTHHEGADMKECEKNLEAMELLKRFGKNQFDWTIWKKGTIEDNLYDIPHDSLVVMGAAGHKLIRELVFGSKLEKIQMHLPNSMLVVGPHYIALRNRNDIS